MNKKLNFIKVVGERSWGLEKNCSSTKEGNG
jgi:hypothetical protein